MEISCHMITKMMGTNQQINQKDQAREASGVVIIPLDLHLRNM
jgi:hypothetical protein